MDLSSSSSIESTTINHAPASDSVFILTNEFQLPETIKNQIKLQITNGKNTNKQKYNKKRINFLLE